MVTIAMTPFQKIDFLETFFFTKTTSQYYFRPLKSANELKRVVVTKFSVWILGCEGVGAGDAC